MAKTNTSTGFFNSTAYGAGSGIQRNDLIICQTERPWRSLHFLRKISTGKSFEMPTGS